MKWDFQCCLDGVFPHRDPFGNILENGGQQIAEGHFLGIVQLRADMKHLTDEYHFRHYNSADRQLQYNASNLFLAGA